MAGFPAAYFCIKAFSQTDQTEDLKKLDVPTLIIHGILQGIKPNSEQLVPKEQNRGKLGGSSGIGLGIVDGRLAPCPDKPSCVSSQAAVSDKQHHIEALTYNGEPAQAPERLERTG